MTKGIIIGTSEFSKDFLKPCLDSLKGTPYKIIVVSNGGYIPEFPIENLIVNEFNGWELAVITRGKENFDEFVHIHDTTIIKDISLFDKLFAIEGNVILTHGNFHYMGKFVTEKLPKSLPIVHDKVTAILLECRWLDGYEYTEFEPDLKVHSDVWEEIYGKKRMRLENDYMIKWKGTCWMSQEQMDELTEENRKRLNESTSSKPTGMNKDLLGG